MKMKVKKKSPSKTTNEIQSKHFFNGKMVGQSPYLSIITLNANGLKSPIKRYSWLNGLHAAYRKHSLPSETCAHLQDGNIQSTAMQGKNEQR